MLTEKNLKLRERSDEQVKDEVSLEKLGFKRIWAGDDSCYWFTKTIKKGFFTYRINCEFDPNWLVIQIPVIMGSRNDNEKEYEDIYRYLGKITIKKVKEVIKMIN